MIAKTTKRSVINIVFDDGTSYYKSFRPGVDRKSVFSALDKMAVNIKTEGGLGDYHPLTYKVADLEAEIAELKAQLQKKTQQMTDYSDLIFAGFTNGDQLMYAAQSETAEGAFYRDSDGDCLIPLYMLKSHAHRVETTSLGKLTIGQILEAREK